MSSTCICTKATCLCDDCGQRDCQLYDYCSGCCEYGDIKPDRFVLVRDDEDYQGGSGYSGLMWRAWVPDMKTLEDRPPQFFWNRDLAELIAKELSKFSKVSFHVEEFRAPPEY